MDSYVDTQQKARFFHKSCGNYIWKRPAKMIMENPEGCYICNGKNKWKTTESFQQELLDKYGGLYTLLGEYSGARIPTLVRNNECGHEFMISPDNLLRGKGCPFHNIQHSSYMKLTEQIMERNSIRFSREKRYQDCINPNTGRVLPFDYYLDDYNTLVEVDGEFHFWRPRDDETNPWWDYEGTAYRDSLKTQYAAKHGIPLIRLPYYEKENFEEILLYNLYANTEVTEAPKAASAL